MRVYHFLSKEHALNNVDNEWLKVATISGLNDPFEFYVNFYESGVQLPDDSMQVIKGLYNDRFGLLCFSECFGNPVQWAHYAEKHYGVCLEFDIPEERLLKIEYRDAPYTLDITGKGWRESYVDATTSKYKHWKYEKEYRMIIKLDHDSLVRENELIFLPFTSFTSPIAAYAGVNCTLTQEEITLFNDKGLRVHNTYMFRDKYEIGSTNPGHREILE